MYTAVFTERSEFFRATRKPEWLARNPKRPVDLKEEDPEVFNEYMNCVYFGAGAFKHYADDIKSCSTSSRDNEIHEAFGALIRVYLLADKLHDLATANIAIDEIIRFSDIVNIVPRESRVCLAYSHTAERSPLRLLMRDFWVYDMNPSGKLPLHNAHADFLRDIALEFFRAKDKGWKQTVDQALYKHLKENTKKDKCHYHQHDEKHPRCGPEPGST